LKAAAAEGRAFFIRTGQARDRAGSKLLLAGQSKINDKNTVRAFAARRPE
jgi:hypothetical protein